MAIKDKWEGKERFLYAHQESAPSRMVLIDKETGVNYLVIKGADGFGGVTPLLNADGTPIVTEVSEEV